jgi:membrane protein implicated in regulation of membrane protease activity
MMLAIGLVALGGAMVWKRGEPRYLIPIVVGCLIAVATRPYAGWFLIAAGAAILLHAGLRAEHRARIGSLALVSIVVLFAAIAAPTVLNASTDESLQKNLQGSQDANATDNSNLSLEQVDFSTRGAIVRNLPRRSFTVLLRPFPWQLGNISQGLGLLGTTAAYLALFFLIRQGIRNRGRIMERAGPLVYLTFFLLVAYSLSSGNAGTAFRYRVQIVSLFICLIAALWWPAERRRPVEAPTGAARAPLEPVQA